MRFGYWGRAVAIAVLSLTLCCANSFAQEVRPPRWSKPWIVSVAALAAASFADAYSSRGRYEANPMLRDASGRASMARMTAFKAGTVGGTVLLEYFLARKEPSLYKGATIVNFAASGVFTGIAIRNSRIPKADAAP